MADTSNPQITIGVGINATTAPGADQAVSDINRIKAAEAEASSQQEAAAEELTGTQSRARQIANEYKTSIFIAAQALDLLGEASKTAAIGSAEMDAAIEAATRSTVEASAQRAAYNARLRESTEVMLAEIQALDGQASAEEKRIALTDAVTAALQRMGITQSEVALQAQKLNASYEGTARAMVAIKQAELANEVSAIRAELEGTAVAATETASGLEQVGAQLAQRGEQRHILTSIREIAQGGALAVRGEAEATFLLGNALNALLPGIGIFLAIASTAAIITQILEEHHRRIGDNQDATNGYAEGWKDASAGIVASIDQILAAQEKLTKQDEADLAAIREKDRLLRSQETLDKNAAIEKLRQQYIQDEQNPNLTDEQRKDLGKRFEAGKKDIEEQSTIHTADANRGEKGEEYDALTKAEFDFRSAMEANQRTLDSLTQTQKDARSYIDGLGLKVGKNGSVSNAQGDDELDRLKKETDYAEGQYRSAYAGHHLGILPASIEENNKRIWEEAQKKYNDLKSAAQNYDLGDAIKKAKEALDKATENLAATTSKLPTADTEWKQATQASDQARTDFIQDRTQDQIDAQTQAHEESIKRERQERDDNLEARKNNVEANLDLAGGADKDIYQKLLTALEVESLQNKASDAKEDHPGDTGIQALIQSEIQKAQAEGREKVVRNDTEVDNQEKRADLSEAKTALDSAKKAAEAAERAHPELLKGIRGITDVTLRNAALIDELLNNLNPALQLIGRRLQTAEMNIGQMKNNSL